MQGQDSPRQIAKAVARGQLPPRPLFVPLVFTLAAKLEGVPLPRFLADPTKLANALTAVYRHLQTDGIVGYFDPMLEAEALGCQLDWRTAPPTVVRPRRTPDSLSPSSLMTQGRIPVALDVMHRLRIMLRGEPVLVASVTGPVQLGQHLFGNEFVHQLALSDPAAVSVLERLATIALHMVQAFCQAGADILIVLDVAVPETVLEQWQMGLAPVWNVIRFHEVVPVLLYGEGFSPPVSLDGSPVVCFAPAMLRAATPPSEPFALILPPNERQAPDIERWILSDHCILVAVQVPYHLEIQNLGRIVNAVRSLLRHGKSGPPKFEN